MLHIPASWHFESRILPRILSSRICYNTPTLHIALHTTLPWARTDLGQSRCDIKGARLWNMYFDTVNPLLHRKSFRKRITKYFVSKYIWLIRPYCVSSFIISTATENICIEQMCICTIYKMYTSYCHFLTRCIIHSPNSSAWMTRCYVPSVQSVACLLLLWRLPARWVSGFSGDHQ